MLIPPLTIQIYKTGTLNIDGIVQILMNTTHIAKETMRISYPLLILLETGLRLMILESFTNLAFRSFEKVRTKHLTGLQSTFLFILILLTTIV